ncbi:diiron oxygenase [Rhodococcus sp. HNM0563]|uniref:AurF N-oxygenase family protein n=1 Tax=unclassified Rhodococcus (in: high G+C Gram-positive bacteria) TaxID=192944 RepID=UPI00146B5E0A|nr:MULTISPECIES: diiron oxygenase [unclassified Rhodococcus (in: high G+C Gram-positive bacteria)]MCK0090162.1 diiron oxygenase [Rhodococcus sp. F64268]NLU64689.1 diiron oxygenase [Rhodococcus sp. HNM0563]
MSITRTNGSIESAPGRVRGSSATDGKQGTAQRLLDSAARKSYDPAFEIDWDAPIPGDKYGMTPEWSSLYGTDLWERMSEQQRIVLTTHEAASIAGTGIWFEMILMQMLIRDLYQQDPSSAYVQFGLTEIADECRHSIMFARSAQRLGVPSYRPKRWIRVSGRGFKAVASGALAFGATLFAEEILDMMQRDFMRDERVQPLTRTVSHIHVVEESRHIRYAREETERRMRTATRAQRAYVRMHLGVSGYLIVTNLINDQVYAAAGLDIAEAKAAARANTHYHDKLRQGTRRTVEFLDSVGLIGGPSAHLLRKAHVL